MIQKYNITECPLSPYLKVLDSHWTFFVLLELKAKKMRFLELKKSISPITNRALALNLQKTTSMNVIKKEKNEYVITNKGSVLLNKVIEGGREIIQSHPLCTNCRGKSRGCMSNQP